MNATFLNGVTIVLSHSDAFSVFALMIQEEIGIRIDAEVE
jgi:hypothetical protein